MKRLFLLVIISLTSLNIFAQDFPFGQVDDLSLEMKKYAKDTSAHAVVLNEFASARIAAFGTMVTGLIYEYHVQIKFFDTKAFNEGTVAIRLFQHVQNMQVDEVRGLRGLTFYKDDKGFTQAAELDTTHKVYQTRENDGYVMLKFAMPAMTAGCIVEYTYQVWSPYNYQIPTLYFQSVIPKIHSEYNVHIPGLFTYHAILKGPLKLTRSSSKYERGCFIIRGVSNDCSDLTYQMEDIPAFAVEDYTASPKNSMSAIVFELSEYTIFTGITEKITTDWKHLDRALYDDLNFGFELHRENFIKKVFAPDLATKTDQLEKAKSIYLFMQRHFKWNQINGYTCQNGLKDLVAMHTGNVGDINLALIAALRSAGLQSDPVLLSTRENGIVDRVYPTLKGFNYVIARLTVNNEVYYLDATDPLLSFGLLPLRCLNGQGRVIRAKDTSYWTDLTATEKRSSAYSYDMTLNEDNKLSGVITIYSAGYSGYEKRNEILGFNSIDEYIENSVANSSKFKILRSEIANIDSLDQPLKETYYVEMKDHVRSDNGQLRFNPFLHDHLSINPLKANERIYPLDFGMPSDTRISLTIHLPARYHLHNSPQNVNYVLPENSGKFATYFDNGNNDINFLYTIRLNKAVFNPDEYQGVKELFNKIILTEKSDLTFSKRNE